MPKCITDTTKAEALLANRAVRSQAPKPVVISYYAEAVVRSAAGRGLAVAIEVVHIEGKWAISASIGDCTAAAKSLNIAVRAAAILYNRRLSKRQRVRLAVARKVKPT